MALKKNTAQKNQTIAISYSDVDWIKNALSEMQNKLQDVDLTLVKLNQTVVGDKNYGQVGLIEQVKSHNDYIEKDKEFKSKLVGGGFVVGIFWTVMLKFWNNIFH